MRPFNKLIACAMALVVPLCMHAQTEIEPNNGSGTATVLTYNTAMTGRMGVCSPTDNSVDYFKIINLPQGQMRVQSTMSNTGPTDLEVTVQVRQTTTSVIGTYSLTAGANGTPVNDSFVFPCQGGTGNYYLTLVNPSTTYCTNYTFTVDAVAPFFANDTEPNNGGGSAVSVAVNTWQQGQANFYYGDNADYFRLDLPSNGVLNLEWEAENASPTASTATVILRNTTTSAIQTWTLPVGANSIPVSGLANLTCRSNTNYYLLSVVSNICGTSYRFRYNVTAPVFANDPEPNNGTTNSPTPVAPNNIQQGQINFLTYTDNSDYFVLTLPTNGSLAITMELEHVGTDAAATATVSLRQSTSSVIQTWTVPVGANSTPTTTVLSRNCLGNTNIYYMSIVSNICGASYRFSYNVTPPVFANDLEPNNTEGTSLPLFLDAGGAEGNINNYYDGSGDEYNLYHNGGQIVLDISAEHFGPDTGQLSVTIQNHQYNNTLHGTSIPVGPNSTPIRSLINVGPFPAQGILVILSSPTCGVSYKFHCRDADNDGTCNASDLCASTPSGEGVNNVGCSCSQVIISDGDACTLDACSNGTVTHTFQDADSDGTCDASDGCPNDANKTAPGACGCGVADTDSDSDGLANCNDNCPNYPGQIGSNCDDGNVNTTGDLVTAACTCAGSTVPCPTDGNACTLEIVVGGVCTHQPLPDADADGTCDLNDGCPNDANKIAAGICGCGVVDTDTDSDGTADCLDGCPGDPNKTAPGSCGCGVADTDSDGDAAADCIDGCPSDPNKTAPGICGCGLADTDGDGDGIANCNDSCPNTPGMIGTPCSDTNASTENDVVNADCICAGTPVTNCTQNLTIEFQTDANPGQISWEIRQQGTNNFVQSGAPGSISAINGTQTISTCVPDGCYYLKVMDSGNNGMGGYILRTSSGIRLIDNGGNFTSGGVSQIAGGEGFCFPMGTTTSGIYTSCDKLDWLASGEYYVCGSVPAVSAVWNAGALTIETTSGYEFWIYNPNGGYSYRRFRSHAVSDGFAPDDASRACHMKINNWSAPNLIPSNQLMNVRVRTRIDNVNGQWGAACKFKIDPARAACPLTKLMDIPGNPYLSCGATRAWGSGNYVHAVPVTGATQYQFRFRIAAEGFLAVRTASTYFVQLNWVGSPLQVGKTYDVEVRAFKNGAWCINNTNTSGGAPFVQWGDVCQLSIANTPASGGSQNFTTEEATGLRMYPNPNRGDQLYLSLDAVEEGVQTVSADIFDLFGRRVSTRTIAVQDGFVNTVLDLNGDMANGMYMVNIAAGSKRYNERLVIQH